MEKLLKNITETTRLVWRENEEKNFIANALAPAKNVQVFILDEKEKQALAVVDEENFSLAIGRKGQNAKLASKLTHYKIDIKTTEQAREAGINFR